MIGLPVYEESPSSFAWIYYLIGGILLLAVIALLVLFIVHHKYASRFLKHRVWKKLYRLVQNQDWYLLNNVAIRTENESIHISHLLVADKFVYVISSRYFEDDLAGDSYSARFWQVVDKDGRPLRTCHNPVVFNENRTMLLAGFLGWNQSKTPMFVSIVVINDSTELHIRNPKLSPYSYIVHAKDIYRFIRNMEKNSKLPRFDQETLDKMIPRLHRLSEETWAEERKQAEKDGSSSDKKAD